jgi:hypothetical protein
MNSPSAAASTVFLASLLSILLPAKGSRAQSLDGFLRVQRFTAHRASSSDPSGDKVRLELRAGGWVPQRLLPGSTDLRTLGIRVSLATMRSASGGTKIFNANNGDWIELGKPKPSSQTR